MTPRWGFRARLTALIAVVFILGGAVLLTVQYVLVRQLLATGIATISTGCVPDLEWTDLNGADADAGFVPCIDDTVIGVGDDVVGAGHQFTIQQTSLLSQEVLSGLLAWSVVVLVVFAGVAVLAARWLSQRSLGRIARIADTTREITRDDLHRRLALPGPADEIKALGDTIDGMLDRLQDAFTRQGSFVAAASHELRTPLTTTRTALEIPLEQGRFGTDVEPAVRRALAANIRSERLIAALLMLARINGDPSPPDAQAVELTAVVADALAERAPEASTRGIRAVVTHPGRTASGIDAGPPAVHAAADPTLASMLVGNLVENAIRHNVDDGELRVELTSADGRATLTITNDGRPLTASETALLIEPFHRGDRTRLTGVGAGLGLTLAEALARRLCGTLTLTPRADGGLIVQLVLPAA